MHFTKMIIKPPVFAHRGASQYAPENTFAAFNKAKELGIRWLEFDVMLSADEQLVVIHDETLDRTTDGSGYVHDYDYHQLKQLDAGSWYNSIFSGETIPLLSDVVQWMQQHDMFANIEIKALPGEELVTAKQLLDVLHQHWSKDIRELLISSFSLDALYRVRELNSHCSLGLLMDEWMPEWEHLCDELNCVSINPNQIIMDQSRVNILKSSGRSVFCYTVNDVNRAKELFSWGVDAVYSDCPDRVMQACHPRFRGDDRLA